MTIVIADDSMLLRERIRDLLKSYKNVTIVGEAENGSEALKLIIEKVPNLAILDVRMPDMNGIEVLKKIREIGLDVKICMLTNYPYKQYRDRCLSEGANYFFDKNLAIDELKNVISRLADSLQ
jgi:DNA-binding NarL/FixJ family response regulator